MFFRNAEFENLIILSKVGICAPVIARFRNGLVVGFLPGESLTPNDLAKPEICLYDLYNLKSNICIDNFVRYFLERGRSRAKIEASIPTKTLKTLGNWTNFRTYAVICSKMLLEII